MTGAKFSEGMRLGGMDLPEHHTQRRVRILSVT